MPRPSPSIKFKMGSHVESNNVLEIIKHTPLCRCNRNLSLGISSCTLFSFPKPHHVRYPTPHQVISHQSAGGRCERTQDPSKMDAINSIIYIYIHQGSTLRQPNLGLPFTRTPLTSSLNTLVAIQYSSIFSMSLQTISILSDPLFSPTPFIFQPSYAPPHFVLYPFVTLPSKFSNTLSQ